MFRRTRQGVGFTILLVSLTAGLLVWPLFDVGAGGRFAVRIAVLGVMWGALWKLGPPRWVAVLSAACAGVYLVVAPALGEIDSEWNLAAEHAAGIAFLLVVAGVITRKVWLEREVDAETIVGSVAVYLMVAAVFSLAYQLLELLAPGSFAVASEAPTQWGAWEAAPGQYPRLFFFSFVTLTTLGYGDVVPASPLAASLASLEAIVGPLYLTVLIARLVGLHVAGGRNAGDSLRPR